MSIRRAKIVCTIGPASDSLETLVKLIEAGMDVARLNFSHGSHEEHLTRMERIREASDQCGRPVALLQDLCGPKIRCGKFEGAGFPIATGSSVVLKDAPADPDACAGPGLLYVQYEGLANDLEADDQILIDDGRIVLRVESSVDGEVKAEVVQGGSLRDKVGVHLPADRVSIATLTEKDKRDLAFGLAQGVDYVALSFVRCASEVQLVREICEAWGTPIPVISKIETPGAMENLESIIIASDAVMVARGDLGVEFSPERVPIMQRTIMGMARRHQRPVIIATEMMQSMTKATRPTRAEASDVATAVFEGTDAVMLSGETAMGAHPVLVVETMSRIIQEAEQSSFYSLRPSNLGDRMRVSEAIARNACDIAEEIGARVIVAFTESGQTARFSSQARPTVPIIGLSPNGSTLRRLALFWGVSPWYVEPLADSDEMINRAHGLLLAHGIVSPGDSFVTIYGAPVGVSGTTNAIHVQVVE